MDVSIEGRRLSLSNLDKVLYPQTGFTKAAVIDYYRRIAPVLLPHLRNRPLTLKRYPNGVDKPFFYEKNCPSHRPEWVKTARVRTSSKEITFCLVQDLATLVWAANLADLEMHVPLHRYQEPDRPDSIVFDLDPGPPAGIDECRDVALLLKGMFDALDLRCLAKTSGSKGMQVYVPLNSSVTYDETKPFALAVAETLERKKPKLVVSNMKKSLRGGKVLVDWSQNDPHKTTVCVYSLRAKERPTVSTPLTWEEVRTGAPAFDADEVLRRVDERGDLFAPLLSLGQKLPRLH
jgi:bifunctional non-homologous end joining protein LigD